MKKKMKKLKKQIKGITLIALVITIIVLLILAAVAINLTIGSNGIFTRTKDAVDRYELAAIEEKIKMEEVVGIIDSYIPGGTQGINYIKGIYAIENSEKEMKMDCIMELEGKLYRANLNVNRSENDMTVESATKMEKIEDIAMPLYIMLFNDENIGDIEFKVENEEEGYIIIRYKNTNYIITVEETEISNKASIDYYEGNIDQTPGELEGAGTEGSPYLIQSIEDLVAFSERSLNYSFSGEYISLDTDLDFNSDESYVSPYTTVFGDINRNDIIEPLKTELTTGRGFFPIAYDGNGFRGSFNGNNYIIKNLYMNDVINQSNADISLMEAYPVIGFGLFSRLNDGEIKNLKVTGNITSSLEYVGGIVGDCVGDSVIENCVNEVNITAVGSSSVGGITGGREYESFTILDCKNYGNISIVQDDNIPEEIKIGGIIGCTDSGRINNCINYGTIKSISDGTNLYKGDIYGKLGANGEKCITNCENMGTLEVETVSGQNSFTTYIGGIIGILYYRPM